MKNKKIRYGQVFDHIALILLLILVLFPFYILIVNSFKLPKDILKNPFAFPGTDAAPLLTTGYAVAWRYIKGYILNTVIVAAMEVAGTLLVASLAAFGFTRFRFKGINVLFMVFLAFMMIPGILTLASQYSLVYSGLNLGQTFFGVALPAIAGGLPMGKKPLEKRTTPMHSRAQAAAVMAFLNWGRRKRGTIFPGARSACIRSIPD